MKILIVSPSLPVPVNSGGAIRIFNLVRHLAATDEIDFVGLDDGSTPEAEVGKLRAHCRHVYVIVPRRRTRMEDIGRVARKMMRGEPFYTKYVDYPELRTRVREITRATRYDIIQFEHSHLAGLRECVEPGSGATTVLATHNVEADQFLRMSRSERNPLQKVKLLMTSVPMQRWEPERVRAFDTVLAVCERDRQLLLQANPGIDVEVVQNGVDTEAHRPYPKEGRGENILIVGSMDYAPNVEAVDLFLREVFPAVRARVPGCTLTIIGRNPPDFIRRLHRPPLVTVHPDAPDVRPHYGTALVSAVALRSGGGSRLKILEALAMGTPVVSTRVGSEGLDVTDGRDILLADDPAAFARQVVRLVREPDLWQAVADRGRRLVQERYDWKSIAGALRRHYCRCVERAPACRGAA